MLSWRGQLGIRAPLFAARARHIGSPFVNTRAEGVCKDDIFSFSAPRNMTRAFVSGQQVSSLRGDGSGAEEVSLGRHSIKMPEPIFERG